MHCQFFRKLSKNKKYVENNCNNLGNAFHFACRKLHLYNNPQC